MLFKIIILAERSQPNTKSGSRNPPPQIDVKLMDNQQHPTWINDIFQASYFSFSKVEADCLILNL